MLDIEKEKTIRALLRTGMTGREIARQVGVSHFAVDDIRRAARAAKSIPAPLRKEIRNMLFAGLPAGAIEMRLRIPRSEISAVRRYYYLQRRQCVSGGPRKCPACGSMVFPRCDNVLLNPVVISGVIQSGDVAEARTLIEDLASLHAMRIIPNPLFCDLAQRAENLIERINNENQEAHAA